MKTDACYDEREKARTVSNNQLRGWFQVSKGFQAARTKVPPGAQVRSEHRS